jgi:hypothetical protein
MYFKNKYKMKTFSLALYEKFYFVTKLKLNIIDHPNYNRTVKLIINY